MKTVRDYPCLNCKNILTLNASHTFTNKSNNIKRQDSEEVHKVGIIVFLDEAKQHASFTKTTWKKLCSSLHSNQQVICYLCGVMKQNINIRTEVSKGLNCAWRGNCLVEKESLMMASPDYIINPSPSEFRFLPMLLRFSAMHLLHMPL